MSIRCGVDPIMTEIIGNALMSVVDEMGITLVRSAFSPNIRERKDCSTALFDVRGVVVAQAEHIPLHLGSLIGVVGEVLKKYPIETIEPGDVYIANDPYTGGGTHLPDVTMVTPFFYNNKIVMFVGNIAHHADIGGRVPGSIAGDSVTIYEEGLRLPPTQIVSKNKIRDEILDIILLNCRIPDQRRTDILCQIATNNVGIQRLTEVFDKFSEDKVLTGIESLLAYSEKKFRAKISEIPDGTYEFVDYLDDDGITNEYIPIKVAVTIKGDKIHLDFTGSAPQVDGAINVVWHALSATVYYALKAFIDPTLPPNGGFFRAVHINAPKHTIVNATPPAAVGARTDTCQRIASVVIGALGNALPEKAVASSNDTSTTVVLAMYDKNKQKECVYVEAIAGGAGARSNKDGMDGVQVHITNTSNLPIEALEIEYPSLLIERYTFITDSGGPGRFRGGMGLLREIRILDGVVRFSSHGDHHKNPPLGISDGLPGGTGRFTLLRKNGQTIIIPSKTSQVNLYEGDVLRIQSPGGGGYGNPLERDRKLVLKDVKEGRVSIEKAVSMYGTNIRPEDILDDV